MVNGQARMYFLNEDEGRIGDDREYGPDDWTLDNLY